MLLVKKIAVNCGHTASGKGYGAVYKGLYESNITRQVGKELISLLTAKGYQVTNATVDKAATQNQYLQKAVNIANYSGADLFISLHCNASTNHNGKGSECFTWRGEPLHNAVSICEQLNKVGFKNRGVKDGSSLYVIKHTTMPAILIEMFFLDNDIDRSLYSVLGAKKIAQAIAAAL